MEVFPSSQMALSSQQTTGSNLRQKSVSSDVLEAYVKRYTANWPIRTVHRELEGSSTKEDDQPEVFLVTGTTGTLGSQMLADLIARPKKEVGRIYAFNRKHSKLSFLRRHEAIFTEKGNDLSLLYSPKVVFVEGDLSVDGFDIATRLYTEMKDSVTTIIHNAWPVKFTKPLVEFEQNIQGLRNLINFSLESKRISPPRLLFISSIGMVKAWGETGAIPEAPMTNPDLVSPNGYPQSKWVSERILTIAKQETDLDPLIIRVGQLTSSANGCWNENEWFPALVSASRMIGCVPDCGDTVAGFVPLHIGARAIINLRTCPLNFAHVVHPRPITSSKLMELVSESLGIGVKVVSADEWLTKLRSWKKNALNTSTLEKQQKQYYHPAWKLVDFYEAHLNPKLYRGVLKSKYQITGMTMLETTKTSACIPLDFSTTMLPQLDKSEVEKWVGFWRQHCWVDEKAARTGERVSTAARL